MYTGVDLLMDSDKAGAVLFRSQGVEEKCHCKWRKEVQWAVKEVLIDDSNEDRDQK